MQAKEKITMTQKEAQQFEIELNRKRRAREDDYEGMC